MLIAVLIGCTACNNQHTNISESAPIEPLRLHAESTIVYLTDYVPTLLLSDGELEVCLRTPDAVKKDSDTDAADNCLNVEGKGIDTRVRLASDRLGALHIACGSEQADIPVLPAMPRRQAMYVAHVDDNTIEIAFTTEPQRLHIEMFWQNTQIPVIAAPEDFSHTNKWQLQIPEVAKRSKGRSFLRIYATDNEVLFNDLLLVLQNGEIVTDAKELTRHDPQAQVLYSLMIDRFENGNKANDWKMNSPEVLDIVDYQGGDIAGITKKINEGFFDTLGINTIWISPITQNPWDAWGYYTFHANADGSYNNKYDSTKGYTRFSGYHGYWPIYATQIDRRFGTETELRSLLKTAHKHNINVILDYVANHMHIASPTLQEHPDWHTDSILPDGRRNFELWDEARLTTWFDRHIPTLDLEREEVYQPMTDSALFWLKKFDFDGFRHDACKHIPEVYWRTLTQKMRLRYPNRALWMIGETYGSPELIGSYVKTGMLNAQFDFNVYFTAIHALVEEGGDMQMVERVIEESLDAYGAHHTMGNISGNHDQVRFASLAGGAITFSEDGKEAGWTREVGIGNAEIAYKKALLLEALNLTIPGVPCIYQGDEYGEAGGNDPDNRHMMRFSGLTEDEQTMRNAVKQLIALRRSSMPLLYGEYLPLCADNDLLCFRRIYAGQELLVGINKGTTDKEVEYNGETVIVPALGYILKDQ